MKTILFAALLLTATPLMAQVAPQLPAGIEALDAKNGFRKFHFGTPVADIPTWQKRGRGDGTYYIDPFEVLKIASVGLNQLKFFAYEGKFSAVLFTAAGTYQPDELLRILVGQYGLPQVDRLDEKCWTGQLVSMVYTKKTYYGAYGTTSSYAIVYISSNALSDKAQMEKARQAASDL